MKWILPIVFLLGGYVLGKAFQLVVTRRLRRLADRTASQADDFLLDVLGRAPTHWFVLAGIWGALQTVTLPEEQADFVRKALFVMFAGSVTVVAARIAVKYVNQQTARAEVFPSTTIFSNVARALVFIVGTLVVLQTLGVSITPILTTLGVGGLAVALALQNTLSNLFAGLQIIGSGQVKPGDFIRLETGEEGYVADVTWRSTTIRQTFNNVLIVPNAHLASSRVTNFDQPERAQSFSVEASVAYGSDLEKVERVSIEVGRDILKDVPGGVPGFDPAVRFRVFGASSIDFVVVLQAQGYVDQYLIRHEFIKALHARFEKEGIEIPFPVRTVHLRTQGS